MQSIIIYTHIHVQFAEIKRCRGAEYTIVTRPKQGLSINLERLSNISWSFEVFATSKCDKITLNELKENKL